MLLKYLKLVNYGGIYNGMGLNTIEIDFTKCKNRIILIKGDNGSGKSTIENALKPLPDDNTSFISGMNASKEIQYYDELTGISYSIKYIHEYKENSSRKSRGYFYKIFPDGKVTDLNPSGNISSCKEIINEELELDPNYMTLIQLSNTKRGIADLRPSDRKKFVNNILSSTDVYNTMYKNLSKKSSYYKSLMTNITSKIDSIGNIAQLEEKLKSIESDIAEAESLIDQYSEVINKEKGMLLSLDPDSKISDRIRLFNKKRDEYITKINECNKSLNSFYLSNPKLSTINITQDMLTKLNNDIIELEYTIKSLGDKIDSIIISREKDASQLENESTKLKSINSDTSLIEINRIRNELNSRKKEIENRWGQIVELQSITHDEFLLAYDVINSMAEIIIHINTIIPENDINQLYLSSVNEMNQIDNEIDDIISFRDSMEIYEYKLDILEQRPSDCKNDMCPFISDALKAKAILDRDCEKMKNYQSSITELKNRKNSLQGIIDNINENKQLINIYNTNVIILRKLNLGLDNYTDCATNLKSNLAEILSILNGLIDYSNDLTEYKSLSIDLIEIDNKFNSLASQKDLIDMIMSNIDRLNTQIEQDTNQINQINDDISKKNKQLNDMTILLNSLTNIYNLKIDLNEYKESLRIIDEEIEKDKSNIDKIEKINSDIEKLNVNISELKSQLNPLRKDAERIKYKITLSTEYNKEYQEYNIIYTKIETLKYYCSPTTGIQLLFVNMYLNKIMDNANNILRKLFNGTFALLPLIITETEFRIPVAVNGGINHDDITSMSSAQISLISMIISISLLSQTSTKLNIITGDEIDAPFDSENRREFINILLQLMSLVKSSQCILISHNSEIPMNECDIILLKNENDIITEGNIIWSYK